MMTASLGGGPLSQDEPVVGSHTADLETRLAVAAANTKRLAAAQHTQTINHDFQSLVNGLADISQPISQPTCTTANPRT